MSHWINLGRAEAIPRLGSRVIKSSKGDIALFRSHDDHYFALLDRCPHKGGPLSQGIVFGHTVACPLHNWQIDLASGEAVAPDVGCSRTFEVKIEGGDLLLNFDSRREP